MNKRVVSAILGICLCIWLFGREYPIQTWPLSGHSNTVAISPDGQFLATSSGPSQRRKVGNWHPLGTTTVELRRLSDGSVVHTLDAFYVTSLAFSPDNSLIAAGNHLGQIQIWRTHDGKLIHSLTAFTTNKFEASEIKTLTFTPDGQTLVSGAGGQIDVWRVTNGQHRYSLSDGNSSADITPDGHILVIGGSPITLYRLRDGTIFRQLTVNGSPTFSSDGKLLAISHSTSHDDKYWEKVMLYRWQDNTILGQLPSLDGRVIDLAFSPNGRNLAAIYNTSEGDGDFLFPDLTPPRSHLAIWRSSLFSHQPYPTQMQRLWTQKDTINALAFSQDGKILAAGSWDKTVRLWRVTPLSSWFWQILLLSSIAGVLSYLKRRKTEQT